MTIRIAWLSPFTPASGVGTFSKAITDCLPTTIDGEAVDLSILHPVHDNLYTSHHRLIPLSGLRQAITVLPLFDMLIFNIGNNRQHHGLIIDLLRRFPGVVICHDYVYQHVLADWSQGDSGGFAPFASLLSIYGGEAGEAISRRARITARGGRPRYAPWETADCASQPLSEPFTALAAALVVHSTYAREHVGKSFLGPMLQLGMPCDQKRGLPLQDAEPLTAPTRKRPLSLVSFGYIQPTKCIELVIDALASRDRLRSRLRYTIAGYAGEPTYLASLRQRVRDLNLSDVVDFELDVSEHRLAQLAASADLFVNLRRPNTEGASASLVEQLQVGKAVLVLDSGCYAELPASAALKLPADATSVELAAELERLLEQPEHLIAVGAAGRQWAQRWSCHSYGTALFAFLTEQRAVLARRGRARAELRAMELAHEGTQVRADEGPLRADGAWIDQLARARRTLHLFDANLLAVAPALILEKSRDALALHMAEVVFGQFERPNLVAAIADLLASKQGAALYWTCAHLQLVAEAVRTGDAMLVGRVQALPPCHDPLFWQVIEHLPTSQFMAAAQMILVRHGAAAAVHDVGDEDDGFPNRLLLRDLLSSQVMIALPTTLRQWIEAPSLPSTYLALPSIASGTDWQAGSSAFRCATELSGFHRQEPDHVWARGTRGFVGIRLAPHMTHVEVYARQLHATATAPRTLRISCGDAHAAQRVTTPHPVWLGLELGPRPAGDAMIWIEVATDYAARPPDSADRRALGVALLRLKIVAGSAIARIPPHLVPHAAA